MPPGAHSAANPQPLQDILHPVGQFSWTGALTASHTGQSGNTAVTTFFFLLFKHMYFLNIMPAPHGTEAVFHSQHGCTLKGYRNLGWGEEGRIRTALPKCASFCLCGHPLTLTVMDTQRELSLERSPWKGYPPTGEHGLFKVCTASLDFNFLFMLLKNGAKPSDAGHLHHTINICHQ